MAHDDAPDARGILNSLLDDLPGVVYRSLNDRQWTMLALTENVAELTGYDAAELIGNRELAFADVIHPDDRDWVWEEVQSAVAEHRSFRMTYRIETADHEIRWVMEQGRAVPGSEPVELTGYMQDLTDPMKRRLAHQQELLDRSRRRIRQLALLNDISDIVNESDTLRGAMEAALPRICTVLDFDVGHAFLDPAWAGASEVQIWYPDDERFRAFREAVGERDGPAEELLPRWVVEEGRALWMPDLAGHASPEGRAPGYAGPLQAGVAVPVRSGGSILAVLELFTEDRLQPDPELGQLLLQIGVQLGRVWERAVFAREVLRSENQLRSILDSLEGAVFLVDHPDRVIVDCNLAAEEIFGYDRRTLIGSSTELLHPDREAYERFGRESRPALRQEGTYRAEGRLRRADGSTFPTRHVVTLLDPALGQESGAVSVVRDITERKRAEASLRRSEERFRQIAEHIEDVFWISDPEKRSMTYVSPAYDEVWGRSRQELYDDPIRWASHVHPDDRERVLASLPRQKEGEYEEEYRIVRPDGEIRWIWDRAFPLEDSSGEVYRIIGVAEDVTERVELEKQLRQSQKMEAVGRLAGGIAHDFNNLLTIIRSGTDLLLLDHGSDPDFAEELEDIRDATDRAAELVGQLLAFSREQVLRPRVVDPDRIVRDMEQLLGRVIGEDIRVVTDLRGDLPAIRVDPGQIEQVLLNLAVNARDAMPKGGTLTLSTAEEEMEVGDDTIPCVTLRVADTGVGMDDATQAQIFEPFFTTKESGQGTGLGLAMAYGAVTQSGGSIDVHSTPGAGAVFSLRFPAVDEEPEPDAKLRATPSGAPHRSITILVVEDDLSVGRVVSKILRRAGHDVVLVTDAGSGRDRLDADPGFDLLITDLVLPGMSGRELIEYVRSEHPDLGLIAMSGYAETEPGARGDIPPDVPFLRKPFAPDELTDLVRRVIPDE